MVDDPGMADDPRIARERRVAHDLGVAHGDSAERAPGVPHTFDHLVLAVPDLAEGVRAFEELTGIALVPGGSHPGRGTANYLAPLNPRGWGNGGTVAGLGTGARSAGGSTERGLRSGAPLTYLELLGPDPEQDPAVAARSLPGITELCAQRWAVHPDDFHGTVASADESGIDYGAVFDMTRNTPAGTRLDWRLTRRTPLAFGGAQPFLIDWGSSPHPADTLRAVEHDAGHEIGHEVEGAAGDPPTLTLDRLELFGPDPGGLSDAVGVLTGEPAAVEGASASGFRAVISGPRGMITFASPQY